MGESVSNAFFYFFDDFYGQERKSYIELPLGSFIKDPVQGVTKRMATPIIQNMAYFLSFHAKVMKKITLVRYRCGR